MRLSVVVTPGARRSEVVGPHGDGWRVRVAAAPERGRANQALVGLLGAVLGVPRDSVRVVAGHGARHKIVQVEGIEAHEAERRLRAAASS